MTSNGIPVSKNYSKYSQTVLGAPRSRNTFFKRLRSIEQIIGGFDKKLILDTGCGFGFNIFHASRESNKLVGMMH